MTLPARRLVFVHAHPDDETLATGGTIARYATDPTVAVTVVTCTLGEEGEVIPSELAELAPDRGDQLGGYRVGELAAAMAALGVEDHRYLGGLGRFRDSGMALAGDGGVRAVARGRLHPRAFADPAKLEAETALLAALLTEVGAEVVVGYDDDGGYGHPDHVRVHEITVAAAARCTGVRKVYYAVRGRSVIDAGVAELAAAPGMPFRVPEPGELPALADAAVTTRIDVAAQRSRRIAAMRAHATQISVWDHPGAPTAIAMSNAIAQPFSDVEEYVLVGAPAGTAETDLFDGIA